MKKRKFDPETKVVIVLEGLKGDIQVAELCKKYKISETIYRAKKTSDEIKEKAANKELLEQILKEHPFWGYRRVWAYLGIYKRLSDKQKEDLQADKQQDLLQKKKLTLKARRTPPKKPKAEKPREILGQSSG